ncbi:MAG: 2Fe-2S iron-sulfur cluster binding domain-containing protein [Chloroflexi bacterium]|nr:2Fe-2S iron-sulfur cluster binding domain-containing protein [Chloroflexota bacterium]
MDTRSTAVTRRQFLIGAGAGLVVGAAATAGLQALQPAKPVEQAKPAPPVQQPAQPAPATAIVEPVSGAKLVKLNVNGLDYSLAIEPQTTLIEVLKRDLGLTGTKLGCNGSMCSACTVLVDGVAQNSCSLLAIRESGKKIVTVEGLEQGGKLHPVQEAFWTQMGYQCGFCTPGQIMRAVELLNKTKNPTDAQIMAHMSGNMCKCGAYPNILKAVQAAAKQMA